MTRATVAGPFLVLAGQGPSGEGLTVSWTGPQRAPGEACPAPRVFVPRPDSLARSGVPGCLLRGGISQPPLVPCCGKPSVGQHHAGGSVGWAALARQPVPPMAERSGAQPWCWSPGRADKRPTVAVGRDEATQARCQPPGSICQAVISSRTRTLRPARWELVGSGLLIASPTAPARRDAASWVPLHETSGVGVTGAQPPQPSSPAGTSTLCNGTFAR